MHVCADYEREGFIVKTIFMYMDFNKVSYKLFYVEVNKNVARVHVREIDLVIILIIAIVSSAVLNLPFTTLHKEVVIHLVNFVVVWLISLPAAQ